MRQPHKLVKYNMFDHFWGFARKGLNTGGPLQVQLFSLFPHFHTNAFSKLLFSKLSFWEYLKALSKKIDHVLESVIF